MASSDLEFIDDFGNLIGDYLAALDDWESSTRNVLTGPNSFGQLRDSQAVNQAQQKFLVARDRLNRSIRRANDITRAHGRVPPYEVLLKARLNVPNRPFDPYESEVPDRVRLAIRDCLTQTIADLEAGYKPPSPLPSRNAIPADGGLKSHIRKHLSTYIVALIGAIATVIAAYVGRK